MPKARRQEEFQAKSKRTGRMAGQKQEDSKNGGWAKSKSTG